MAKLNWSPRSLNDLEIIFDYIKSDSVDNASNFIKQIIEVTLTVPEFPYAGRVVPEFKDSRLREKLYKNYRIIYRVETELIEVVTILHQSKRLK
ncbi:type II toxin-antitoxin system RelE/ParE family toxin [Microaerobacter geothermalis]|uniref:type II toxin-antitoxin system RelE/ParE family toxin n=1 Tax=Microaerobacter geothermalis TaxID=674972 RepID=UPI001F2A79FD|nr:type II toxin-antitoxin system RelE/ParE family toxin [Microaerobacter geothermalis]MCF6094751.1 type II toxin-antitoxin system RelE/ParE family toxin [Microaerobacter geothermalis]